MRGTREIADRCGPLRAYILRNDCMIRSNELTACPNRGERCKRQTIDPTIARETARPSVEDAADKLGIGDARGALNPKNWTFHNWSFPR